MCETTLFLLFQEPNNTGDESFQTFVLNDEDHTLGNALKYILNKKWVIVHIKIKEYRALSLLV